MDPNLLNVTDSEDKEKNMKEIKRWEIEKSVKEELKEALKWCDGDYDRYYKLMMDVSNGSIWADTFLSQNDWKIYHSDSIQSLNCNPFSSELEREHDYIDDAIRILRASGWIIK